MLDRSLNFGAVCMMIDTMGPALYHPRRPYVPTSPSVHHAHGPVYLADGGALSVRLRQSQFTHVEQQLWYSYELHRRADQSGRDHVVDKERPVVRDEDTPVDSSHNVLTAAPHTERTQSFFSCSTLTGIYRMYFFGSPKVFSISSNNQKHPLYFLTVPLSGCSNGMDVGKYL